MADAVDMKISQLDAAVSVADADVFPETSGAVSKKVPASVLKNYMNGTNDISALGDGSVTGAILNVKSASETADSNIAETMAQNGAHNLCPFPYYSGGTQVISGFTLTVNDNGTMVASGTANEASRFNLYVGKLPKKTYKFRFNGSLSGADIAIYDYVTEQVIDSAGANEDITLTVDATNENHNFLLYINWSSGSISISGRPLLCLATDPSTTDTPYAMTNVELTEKVAIKVGTINDNAFTGTGLSKRSASIVKTGNVVQFTFDIKKDSGSNPFSLVELIPVGFRPKTNTPVVCSDGSEFGVSAFSLTTGGWMNGIYVGTTGYLIGSITYIVD